MTDGYRLYGANASYYTAKVRACMRKKGVPFVERLPSAPEFRDRVRPASGSHRIPQLLTPEGEVIQDSVEILDHLERCFPHLPAFPPTPRQRVFAHLMELLGSEGLLRLAWLHRWLFTENRAFVLMDFGRSFRPQGSDEELRHYGELIAERMMSYGLPESTEQTRRELDRQYLELLALFEQHLHEHPYLLGGHPSAADYAVMGALYAHLGRDPAGLRLMQDRACRTFRWVEQMQVPEVVSPEFFDRPVAWPADDEVPQTALQILRWIAASYGQPFVLGALAFNQAVERLDPPPGHPLDPERDQPVLPKERVSHRGTEREHAANLHAVWLSQRARVHYQSQPPQAQAQIDEMLGEDTLRDLVQIPLPRRIDRVANRLLVR